MRKCTQIGILVLLILLCLVLSCAGALAGELRLPSGLQDIEAEAFMGDSSLDTVILPDGIVAIRNRAFAYSSVKHIYLPESLSSITTDAFEGCNLDELVIHSEPGSYAQLFAYAFDIQFSTETMTHTTPTSSVTASIDPPSTPGPTVTASIDFPDPDPLSIVCHPDDLATLDGGWGIFSVSATGGTGYYTYQWYRASSSTGSGSKISGATSKDYTFTASSTYNGYYFFCVVTSGNETETSSRAKLTVDSTIPASAPVVNNSVTNETYNAKSIAEYNRNNGGFNLTYTSANCSGMYHITAIIINEEPLFDNSEYAKNQKNSDQKVKILYDDDMMNTSIPFALDDLQLGSYLKIAVGAYSANNTTATADAWTVFGIKLINNQPVVVPTDTATNFAGQIWTQLKNWGFTDYQAAGIMGNISAESAYCPYNAQDSYGFPGVDNRKDYIFKADDAVGFGLCQWTTSGRKTALQSSATKGGWTVWDFDAQMNYMLWELNTNYYSGQTWMTYFKSQTTLRDATVAWMKVFENPKDQSTSAQNHRVSLAQTAYDTYTGTSDVKITSISLSSSAQTIGIGGTNERYLQSVSYAPSYATNKSVTWSSGKPSIAEVDPSTGIVTGVAGGSATITATAADGSGKTASYTVYVVGTPTIKLGGTAIAAGTTTTWNTNSDLIISWTGASANRYLYKIITLNEKPAANQNKGTDTNTIINQTTASSTTSYSMTAAQLASYAQSAKYLKIWVQALNSNDTAHGPSAWIGVEFTNSSPCTLEVGSNSWTGLSYEGSNKTISVTSDGNYTISIDQPGRSTRPTDDGYVSNWLSATKTSTGVKLTAKKNYANVSRTATVTLKCATHGTEETITVKQNANSTNSPEVTISLSPTTVAPGGTVTATVTYTNAQRLYLSTAYDGDNDIEKTLSLSTSEKTATYTLTVPSSVSNGRYKVTVNVSNSDIKNDSWALADSDSAYLTVEASNPVGTPVVKDKTSSHTFSSKEIYSVTKDMVLTVSAVNGCGKFNVVVIALNEEPNFSNSDPKNQRDTSKFSDGYAYNGDISASTYQSWVSQYGGIPIAVGDVSGMWLKIAVGAYENTSDSTPKTWLTFGVKVSGAYDPAKPLPTLTGTSQNKIWQVAKSQIGYTETGDNHSVYGAFTGTDGYAWCAPFVSWCASKAALSSVFVTSGTYASPDDLLKKGYSVWYFATYPNWTSSNTGNKFLDCCSKATIKTYDSSRTIVSPQKGDLIFFATSGGSPWAHVGIVESYSSSTRKLIYIDGNGTNEGGTLLEGKSGNVAVSRWEISIDASYICAIARPNY